MVDVLLAASLLTLFVLYHYYSCWHYWLNKGKEANKLAMEALNKPESKNTDDDRRRQKFRDGSGGNVTILYHSVTLDCTYISLISYTFCYTYLPHLGVVNETLNYS